MKFKTDWWGITLIAENEDDESLLAELSRRLPEELDYRDKHDVGTQELERDDDGLLKLVFSR